MNCLLYVLVAVPLLVKAQVQVTSSKQFFWSFPQFPTSVPTCTELPITFIAVNTTANATVPPYYMNAYSPGGTVETQLIGSDPNSLKWTARFPVGTSLMLNVIDSSGGSGGIGKKLYPVVAGSSTECVPAALSSPPADFKISTNVTDKLKSCDPWGISVSGGVKPYKITIVAANSPVATNVTLAPGDDAFTYINRADPDTQMVAAFSDATGRWATGTAIVNTFGSTDLSCPGANSAGGSAALLAIEADERAKLQKKRTTTLVVGILVPVLVLLIAGCVGGYFWYRKRVAKNGGDGGSLFTGGLRGLRRLGSTDGIQRDMETGQTNNRMEARSDGLVLSIASYLDGPPTRAHTLSGSTSTMSPTMTSPTYTLPPPASAYTTRSSSLNSAGTMGGARPGFSSFPRQSTRHAGSARGSSKAVEAGFAVDDDEGNFAGPARQFTQHPDSPMSANGPSSGRRLPTPVGAPGEGVFQHTDGGIPLAELPPPYMLTR